MDLVLQFVHKPALQRGGVASSSAVAAREVWEIMVPWQLNVVVR
jgi:hypothetical protein